MSDVAERNGLNDGVWKMEMWDTKYTAVMLFEGWKNTFLIDFYMPLTVIKYMTGGNLVFFIYAFLIVTFLE